MRDTFDTLDAAHRLEAAGMERDQAEAIAAVVRQSQGDLVTTGLLSALEARLHCALWIQAAGIIATIAVLAGIVFGLASLWSGQ